MFPQLSARQLSVAVFSVANTIRLAESRNIDIKCLFMTPEGLAEAGFDAQANQQHGAGDW